MTRSTRNSLLFVTLNALLILNLFLAVGDPTFSLIVLLLFLVRIPDQESDRAAVTPKPPPPLEAPPALGSSRAP